MVRGRADLTLRPAPQPSRMMASIEATPAATRERELMLPRRHPLTWIRGGGLSNVLFLLPLLFVFGAFSWYPIVRTVVMSLQHTNLVQPATWVGLDNFRTVLNDPVLPKAVRT